MKVYNLMKSVRPRDVKFHGRSVGRFVGRNVWDPFFLVVDLLGDDDDLMIWMLFLCKKCGALFLMSSYRIYTSYLRSYLT